MSSNVKSTEVLEAERIRDLDWRLKRLENFIGNGPTAEKKRITESIRDLNESILRHANNNNNAKTLMNKAEDLQHLTSADFQRRLIADRSTKLELILADEERIRDINENLSQIEHLARVLDEKTFQDIPKLFVHLNKLLTMHHSIKDQHGQFTEELTEFLQDYAAFTLTMDENLHQYKKLLNKTHEASQKQHDEPIE